MIITCKQVSKALRDHRYYELPWYRRWGLQFHVGICAICGRYHRQVMALQDGIREFLDREEEDQPYEDMRLTPEARERIAGTLSDSESEG